MSASEDDAGSKGSSRRPTQIGRRYSRTKADPSEAEHSELPTFKVLLLGDSEVGKTCLMIRFCDGIYRTSTYMTTVGIDFRTKHVDIDDKRYVLQFWDTAGQERYRSMTASFYKNADAILLVYDVSNVSTFNNISEWLAAIKVNAPHDTSILLAGNKADVEANTRQVKENAGLDLAEQHKLPFVETSAKTGLNVTMAITGLARAIIARKQVTGPGNSEKEQAAFDLSDFVNHQNKKSSCCR